MVSILSTMKGYLVPSGAKPRSIKFGPFKGLKMNLDLRNQTQMWLGLAEREVFPHLRTFVRQAKTGIDIGAADGEYTLFFLSQPNIKHVLSFEPSERSQTGLATNLVLNGFSNDQRAILMPKYVSNYEDDEHCTLDSVALSLEGPYLVKIDVDGEERAVLQGAEKLLDRNDVSWIIETHSSELERECEQILKTKGLTTAVIKNAWWRALVPEMRIGPLGPHNRWLAGWRDSLPSV